MTPKTRKKMRDSDESGDGTAKSPGYAWWSLSALTFLAVLDYADRALIGSVADPIKEELGLTDTQLGILMGAAFVVARVAFSLPIGRIADTVNRRNIIALSTVILSLANVAFGLARTFWQIFLARAVFGASTAGSAIPSMSIIADLFPMRVRGFAMSIWHLSGTLGWAIGAASAAIVTQYYGWRAAVIAFGVLGAIFSVVFLFTVREPVRRDSTGNRITSEAAPPLKDVFDFAIGQRGLWHMAAGFGLLNATDMMMASWAIPFLTRIHDMALGAAGSAYGLAVGIGSVSGVLIGGKLFDYLGRRDLRWHSWLVMGSALLSVPLSCIFYLGPSLILAVSALTVVSFILATTYAASTSLPMGLVRSRMRAVTYAVYSMFIYTGWAAGPVFAGYLSTRLEPSIGPESLRYALLAGGILFGLWAATHFFLAARTIRADYERAVEC